MHDVRTGPEHYRAADVRRVTDLGARRQVDRPRKVGAGPDLGALLQVEQPLHHGARMYGARLTLVSDRLTEAVEEGEDLPGMFHVQQAPQRLRHAGQVEQL